MIYIRDIYQANRAVSYMYLFESRMPNCSENVLTTSAMFARISHNDVHI